MDILYSLIIWGEVFMSNKLVITKIEKQKKGKRYNIYLNDLYAFSIHEDILVSHRLLKDNEINEDNIKELFLKDEENKAWNKSLRYLSYKSRTEEEIRKYLINNSYDIEIINLILERLKEQGYINDTLYAQNYIRQRISLNPKGKKMIAYELVNKGISEIETNKALDEIDDEVEYNMAIRLVDKKVKGYRSLEWESLQNKLGNYLQRRGFSYSLIIKVLQDYKNNL